VGIDCVEQTPVPVDVRCMAPALAAGRYPLIVGGVAAGEVVVGDLSGSALVCYSAAAPAPVPATTCTNAPASDAVADCTPVRARSGVFNTLPFHVPCADCFAQPGTCGVHVSGHTISVTPVKRRCDCATCGACPPVCRDLPLRCVLPPLRAGTYQVFLNGRVSAPLQVRDDAAGLMCGSGSG